MIKKFFSLCIIAILVITAVVLFNAFRFDKRQLSVKPIHLITINEDVASKLATSIRFKTISSQSNQPANAFNDLDKYLRGSFPRTYSMLAVEPVGEYGVLFTWKGRNPTLKPILLLAHLDVVPVDETLNKKWSYPAFEGVIANGYIWGRGAMDDKASALATLEAIEHLIQNRFTPQRTVYLAFGKDEEIGGKNGALKIAQLLHERQVKLEAVLDEGLIITEGILPNLTQPVALIGIAEKGYLSIKITARGSGGHSSMPATTTVIGTLASAISKLEKDHAPAHLISSSRQLFEYIGPEMSFNKKALFANLWLFEPLVRFAMAKSPTTNALVRTTAAPTIVQGGIKDNVMPTAAYAIVNYRILPGDSIKATLERVNKTINDPNIEIVPISDTMTEPSREASTNSRVFTALHKSIREVFPNVIVAPSLAVPTTDSRHYAHLTENIYRFVPIRANKESLNGIHGINERISVKNYVECIKFYIRFLTNASG